jgi:hypothetical protein
MMLGSSLQSLGYLLLLASCYFILLSALKGVRIKLKKEKSRRGGTLPDAAMTVYAILTNERIITQAMMARMLVIGLAVGFVAGYNGKVIQHYHSVETFNANLNNQPDKIFGIHVLHFVGDGKYLVRIPNNSKPECVHEDCTMKFYPFVPEFEDDSYLEWIKLRWTPQGINVADPDLGYKVLRANGEPVKFSQVR